MTGSRNTRVKEASAQSREMGRSGSLKHAEIAFAPAWRPTGVGLGNWLMKTNAVNG